MDLIDFTWWRCLDGYERIRRPARVWKRGGGGAQVSGREAHFIQSKGKRFETYQPTKIPSEALFRNVIEFPTTPEGMVTFSNAYGLMTHAGSYLGVAQARPPTSESTAVDEMLSSHAALRRGIALFEAGEQEALVSCFNSGMANARHELRLGPNGKVFRVLVPHDLIQAMWIQFAAHVESDAELARCHHCGQWHRTGTGIGRRSTLKYCSDICRKAAHRAKKEA